MHYFLAIAVFLFSQGVYAHDLNTDAQDHATHDCSAYYSAKVAIDTYVPFSLQRFNDFITTVLRHSSPFLPRYINQYVRGQPDTRFYYS